MQRGSVFMYILVAVALLGVLTMSFVEPGGQQSRTQNANKLAMELKSQVETYRTAVQDCVLTYPQGDTSGPDPLYAGYNKPYPVSPNNSYLPVGLRDAAKKASSIRCPGNPGDSNNHSLIFSKEAGRFAPPSPPMFETPYFYNGSDGVRLAFQTTATDAYVEDAMKKAQALLGACETTYLVYPSCGTVAGTKCLLVYIVRNLPC